MDGMNGVGGGFDDGRQQGLGLLGGFALGNVFAEDGNPGGFSLFANAIQEEFQGSTIEQENFVAE